MADDFAAQLTELIEEKQKKEEKRKKENLEIVTGKCVNQIKENLKLKVKCNRIKNDEKNDGAYIQTVVLISTNRSAEDAAWLKPGMQDGKKCQIYVRNKAEAKTFMLEIAAACKASGIDVKFYPTPKGIRGKCTYQLQYAENNAGNV